MAKRTLGATNETPKIEKTVKEPKKKLKIQLIGAVSSASYDELELFSKAENLLTKKGFEVFNPLSLRVGETWEWYMRQCIAMLTSQDYIMRLPSWVHSKGATIENEVAIYLGIPRLELWDVL